MLLVVLFPFHFRTIKTVKTYQSSSCRLLRIPRLSECADINIQRRINFLADIFSVLLPLLYTFRQQIFNLTIDRAKVILCPCGYGIVQLRIQSQRNLFFLRSHFLNTANRSSQSAAHRGCRRVPPADSKPLPLCVLHPARRSDAHSVDQVPFPPYQLRRLQSSFLRQ